MMILFNIACALLIMTLPISIFNAIVVDNWDKCKCCGKCNKKREKGVKRDNDYNE